MKVIELNSNPNADVVRCIEQLLAEAREGRFNGVACVLVRDNEEIDTVVVHDNRPSLHKMVAGSVYLTQRLLGYRDARVVSPGDAG